MNHGENNGPSLPPAGSQHLVAAARRLLLGAEGKPAKDKPTASKAPARAAATKSKPQQKAVQPAPKGKTAAVPARPAAIAPAAAAVKGSDMALAGNASAAPIQRLANATDGAQPGAALDAIVKVRCRGDQDAGGTKGT